jgi:hypothetical protein
VIEVCTENIYVLSYEQRKNYLKTADRVEHTEVSTAEHLHFFHKCRDHKSFGSHIPSTLLRIEFSQISQAKLHQGLTTKLAHLNTLYKFCKVSRVLDQRIWHKLQGNLTEISALVNSESRH